ncbi:MAG: PEGA domain-containing protein [candidate division Zixibacteria bacterium]|nr:PEGA domain-containing protein [candidate division Zixibacteria bacterium]
MKKFVVLTLILLVLNGCGAIFLGSGQNISMNTDPEGATVIINGNNMGKTPIHLKLKTNDSYIVTFKKDGYEDKTYSIANRVSGGIIVLDVLCGLLPVIVDAATGSWYRLDTSNIDLPLDIKRTY